MGAVFLAVSLSQPVSAVSSPRPSSQRERAAQAEGGWVTVGAGWEHSCGLRTDGTLWCWGRNSYGELGDGTRHQHVTPRQVGADTDWAVLDVGYFYNCALKTDATLWCWGQNQFGQLGDGTVKLRTTPTQVAPGTTWRSVEGAYRDTCGVQTDGTAWCWGVNFYGQLGNGQTGRRRTVPTQVGTETDWRIISPGGNHTCGVKTSGTLWCWGRNDWGQLGDGTEIGHSIPGQVGTGTDWTTVSSGGHGNCALRTGDALWCWGDASEGRLGLPFSSDRSSEVLKPQRMDRRTWPTVSKSWDHTCALQPDGSAWCWGIDANGELGNGTTGVSYAPVAVLGDGNWVEIAAGFSHTCGVQADGTAWCWGNNDGGQLGDGTTVDRWVPTPVS